MAMKLSNVKIGHKVVGLVVLALLMSGGISALVLNRLMETTSAYSDLLAEEVQARIIANRLNTSQQEVGRLDSKMVGARDPTSVAAAYSELEDVLKTISENHLAELETLIGDSHAAELQAARQAVTELVAGAPLIRAAAVRGDDETAFALADGQFAEARSKLETVAKTLITDLRAEMEATEAAATAKAQSSIVFSVAAILLCLVSMTALGMWVGVVLISRPLTRLTSQMQTLAAGGYESQVAGAERGDEIGDVARTAIRFRENGLERVRLEAASAEFQQDLDRQLKAMKSAFESAGIEQKKVVEAMAHELDRLANGDLGARLSEPVAAEYKQLQDDFNRAVVQLETAMGSINSATAGIRSGAEEIAHASDELS
jgi:methyl-accepting chemotaxis protein